MAKRIASYKGLWKHDPAAPTAMVPAQPLAVAGDGAQVQTPASPEVSASIPMESGASAEHLAHRYRMLVLREHRVKLGRDLLEMDPLRPWAMAWEAFRSLGGSFRPWAHGRMFALACYLGVDMAPEFLQNLRHPLWVKRYRRSMWGLWRLLDILAQKNGQKPLSRPLFRVFSWCLPLAVLIYERKLQAVMQSAHGASAQPSILTKVTQGQ